MLRRRPPSGIPAAGAKTTGRLRHTVAQLRLCCPEAAIAWIWRTEVTMNAVDHEPGGTKAERDEMFSYYEARAEGYDDFYQGKGQAVPELAREYPVDTAGVFELLKRFFGRDHLKALLEQHGFQVQSAYGITRWRQSSLIERTNRSAEAFALGA